MGKQGFGTTVSFPTSAFTAEIDDVNIGGMSREDIDTSHMASTNGWETFEPSDLKNPGELTLNITFDPDKAPPITAAPETITITYPKPLVDDVSAPTWACSGYVKSFSNAAPKKGKMTGTIVVKFSGKPTYTASVPHV